MSALVDDRLEGFPLRLVVLCRWLLFLAREVLLERFGRERFGRDGHLDLALGIHPDAVGSAAGALGELWFGNPEAIEALDELPKSQRQVVVLHHFLCLSFTEIERLTARSLPEVHLLYDLALVGLGRRDWGIDRVGRGR